MVKLFITSCVVPSVIRAMFYQQNSILLYFLQLLNINDQNFEQIWTVCKIKRLCTPNKKKYNLLTISMET